ncbi:MAG: DegT/DnrJ/EryC1/StrS family aminotransferase, partial [Victivallales bacterium]
VLEDCAHATGASYKGHCGKHRLLGRNRSTPWSITTCGEGGMITTNHDEYCDGIQNLRCMSNNHSWGDKWQRMGISAIRSIDLSAGILDAGSLRRDPHNGHGTYRMNEIQAARQLDKLETRTRTPLRSGIRSQAGLQGSRGLILFTTGRLSARVPSLSGLRE